MPPTDLERLALDDPTFEADNALSVRLITYLLWCGGALFAMWIVAIALFL